MTKVYICECGYSTENKQAFCGHRGNCKVVHPNRNYDFLKGRTWKQSSKAWNAGLTKETSDKVRKNSLANQGKHSIPHTPEAKAKISESMKSSSKECGGYRRGSGYGKKGRYQGIWCDSSYELAYLIYCLDHRIQIQRNREAYLYEIEGVTHKYYPDFIVNGKIVEIKGFIREIDKVKFSSVPGLVVITGNRMNRYLNYVIDKYGADYTRLYS